jgi:hypothetical protein
MHLQFNQCWLALLLSTMLTSVGCSARRPIATIGPAFRLQSVNGESVLLSPSIPEHNPSDSAIDVKMNLTSPVAPPETNCLAEEGPFRVELTKQHPDSIQITLPPTDRWIGDVSGVADPDGDAVEALYALLTKLDRLQQEACFGDAGFTIRDFILQSLPMKPSESLFNFYGYRADRSGLDLKPGIRLKIDRAYFRPAKIPEEAQAVQNFAGLSTVNFDVESSNDGKIHFRRIGDVRFNPASLKAQFQDESQESELLSIPPEFRYRLIFYTLLVSKERKLSAAIVGASSASQLDEFDHELRLRPTGGCKNFAAAHGVACVEFNGLVTVTCQIRVELNGKSKLIDWGTRVRDLVPKDSLRSLTMERTFMDSYRDVRFDPTDLSVLSLALVGGDRLRWSKTAPTSR